MSAVGDVFFLLCATVAVLAACGTVFARAPIRSALFLLLHIGSLAALYVTLSAHLLAAVQLIVYAGAVVVLFVFVIMVIGPMQEAKTPQVKALFARTLSIAIIPMIVLSIAAAVGDYSPEWVTLQGECPGGAAQDCEAFGSVSGLALPLFTDAVVPFELVSILLLVAILGAIAVARGRNASEVARLADKRAKQHQLEASEKAYEQQLSAEVSAHGGH